ncbi:cobalt-precorrin 4 C11-methyltransferase [Desulfotomaculum arcticum]|uniref:Cobalt-precorrin 4 C11-methyltransferase n=1 Tax=Desulfotruncus arcticus DSM 17038 TaxID=1121424 RepID=A0A1I2RWS7_9FIRM|nr:precorrin-4 C(11)-methyltransferase [Desulfotruncus arcticus]SFG44523.1 cobalt-precorrin 4 C11-methyltransferase [Desulfotomaculum arcticum] [Desulfotruncus arcticus DSM 17038]
MIYFVGAGPGDPDLITVKGAKVLARAKIVIYAGSLVNKELLTICDRNAEIYNSAGMTLEQITQLMIEGHRKGLEVVRLHTGDPSLYGAIQEQMDVLRKESVPFCVIPGVSSFLAAAAAIPHELTLPGITQTVILTRMEGRTPVPETETLRSLAAHKSTMCIFLSVHLLEELSAELIAGGFSQTTPVAVIEKASWPDERIVTGNLENISGKVKEAGITKTAMIIVSQAFQAGYLPSRLYDADFSHSYRRGKQ